MNTFRARHRIMNLPLLLDEMGWTFHMLRKESEMNPDQMVDVPVQHAS
jgi:hypothetical protein